MDNGIQSSDDFGFQSFLARKIVFTDGAVNVYKEYYENVKGHKSERGPDFVIGDMDSIDSESLEWLNDKVLGSENRSYSCFLVRKK